MECRSEVIIVRLRALSQARGALEAGNAGRTPFCSVPRRPWRCVSAAAGVLQSRVPHRRLLPARPDLIVEIDGAYHQTVTEQDRIKDEQFLRERGIRTL